MSIEQTERLLAFVRGNLSPEAQALLAGDNAFTGENDFSGNSLFNGSLALGANGGQIENLSGDEDDFALDEGSNVLLVTGNNHTLTGLGNGSTGRIVIIQNIETSADTLTLAHDSDASLEANRFSLPGGEDLVLPAGGAVILRYQVNSWWVVSRSFRVGEFKSAIGSIGGGTQDLDVSRATSFSATVDTSATTFTFSNWPSNAAHGFSLTLTNGGSQTVVWPTAVDWAGGEAPELSAAGVDVLVFHSDDGGTTIYGALVGSDFS